MNTEYRIVASLYYMPEINIMLYINYLGITNKNNSKE